jgi:MFS transporter, DHA2 family, multidrug resistance protein
MNEHVPPRATWRQWLGLGILTLPMLMLATDMSVLFLALPSLSADLRPSGSQLLWILHVYGFFIAGFLITMGRLGDRIGRRRLLLIGASVFGAASAVAAFSPNPETLIVVRALLGVAGATLMPSVYSLLRAMFRDRAQLRIAITVQTSTFLAGMALGPPLGGILVDLFWWGAVFLANVPVAVLLLAASALLPEFRDPAAQRLDLPSVGLSLAAVVTFIYGMQEIMEHGLHWVYATSIVAGAVLATVFVHRQNRLADPLLDLTLFRNRAFSVALLGFMVLIVIAGGADLFLTQYIQSGLGYTPLEAGLLMIAPAAAGLVGTLATPLVARYAHPSVAFAVGLALAAAAYAVVAVGGADVGIVVLLAMVSLAGLLAGPAMVMGSDLIISTSPAQRAGSASAMQETSGEMGGALGLAVAGGLGMAVYRNRLEALAPQDVPAEAVAEAGASIGGAVALAEQLPGETGSALLEAARTAFGQGLQFTFILATLGMALGAVLLGWLLRGVDLRTPEQRDADEAEEAGPSESSLAEVRS